MKAALDSQGKARIKVDLPAPRAQQRLDARITFEMLDPSGRPVRGEAVTAVRSPRGLVGVRASGDGAQVVIVDGPAGTPSPVTVRLEKRHWSWELHGRDSHAGYQCRIVSELVEEQRSAGAGSVTWKHVRDNGAWYVASARIGEGDREQIAEQSYGATPLRPDTLRLAGSKQRVRPGTTQPLQIDAPFAGTAFVTVETTTIHGAFVREVHAGRNTLEVPLPQELTTPNVHVVVTLTAPQAQRDASGPFWICGATSIPLAHDERATQVLLEVPARVEPQSKVTLKLRAPGASRATVALVDEGILRLTAHLAPDPLGHFLARRKLAGLGADAGRRLMQQVTFEPGVLIGGDDDASDLGARLQGSIVDTIRTVALRSSVLRLDSNGEAECAFELPPYEGRLRVVAIASGAAVVGATTHPLVVAGPLGVQVAVPRRTSLGDEVLAIVTVRNSSGSARVLELGLEASGGANLAAGELTTRRLEVRDGTTTSCSVRLVVGNAPGTAVLVARVQDGERERIARGEFVVRPLVPFRAEHLGIACDGRQQIVVPSGFVPGTLRARLVVDGDPNARLLPLLQSLVSYPYGCAEQTTSRCNALLACRALLPHLSGDGQSLDAGSLLETGIARLLTMQTHDGGLAFWPGDRQSSPFCSVLGLELLHTASSQGVRVPDEALHGLGQYTEKLLAKPTDRALCCLAAAALAGEGRPIRGWLARLEEEATRETEFVLLALAHSRLGDLDATLRLLARTEAIVAKPAPVAMPIPRGDEDGGQADPGASQQTDLPYGFVGRLDVWRLRALLAVAPGDPRVPLLAQHFERAALVDESLTTQAQGQILLALAAYDKIRGGQARPVVATLSYGTPVSADNTSGRSTLRLEKGKHLDLPLHGGETLEIASDGPLFGLITITGFCEPGSANIAPGLELAQALRRAAAATGRQPTGTQPTDTQPLELGRGNHAEIILSGTATQGVSDLLLTCPLPGGLEPDRAPPTLWTRGPGERKARLGRYEVRDDRVLFFARERLTGAFELVVPVRAVFAGTYSGGRASAEALYDSLRRCTSAEPPVLHIHPKQQ